jgi:hypothetical protein
MKTSTKTILAVLATGLISCMLFSQQAQAVPTLALNGSITFAGGVQLNTGSVNTATQVTGWLDQNGIMPAVMSRDGDFTAFVGVGDIAAFTAPWNFVSGPIAPFWTVDGFTFDLASSSLISQGGGFVNVLLTGSASGHGFGPTFFTGRFSAQDPPAGTPPTFSFSVSFGPTVPDGGATVALLGLALAGIEGMRRKLGRTKS